jgi:hypothetical protein
VIVRWSLGKTDHCQRSRKEPCTRATPRGSSSHARHRSALTTVRLHNRQWHGQRSTLRDGVKSFSWEDGVWASRSSYWALDASLGFGTVPGEKMAGRVASNRYVHTWWTPKDGIVVETGSRHKENTRELDENGSGPGRGPCFAPLGPPAGADVVGRAIQMRLLYPLAGETGQAGHGVKGWTNEVVQRRETWGDSGRRGRRRTPGGRTPAAGGTPAPQGRFWSETQAKISRT